MNIDFLLQIVTIAKSQMGKLDQEKTPLSINLNGLESFLIDIQQRKKEQSLQETYLSLERFLQEFKPYASREVCLDVLCDTLVFELKNIDIHPEAVDNSSTDVAQLTQETHFDPEIHKAFAHDSTFLNPDSQSRDVGLPANNRLQPLEEHDTSYARVMAQFTLAPTYSHINEVIFEKLINFLNHDMHWPVTTKFIPPKDSLFYFQEDGQHTLIMEELIKKNRYPTFSLQQREFNSSDSKVSFTISIHTTILEQIENDLAHFFESLLKAVGVPDKNEATAFVELLEQDIQLYACPSAQCSLENDEFVSISFNTWLESLIFSTAMVLYSLDADTQCEGAKPKFTIELSKIKKYSNPLLHELLHVKTKLDNQKVNEHMAFESFHAQQNTMGSSKAHCV